MKPLTKKLIENWYVKPGNSNVITDWSTTDSMSLSFHIPEDVYVYMNCLNDMRRNATAYTGLRFFDLKRYGIEYSHVWSVDAVPYVLKWNDPRRVIEVPQEVLAAGMSSSREPMKVGRPDSYERYTGGSIFKKEDND